MTAFTVMLTLKLRNHRMLANSYDEQRPVHKEGFGNEHGKEPNIVPTPPSGHGRAEAPTQREVKWKMNDLIGYRVQRGNEREK